MRATKSESKSGGRSVPARDRSISRADLVYQTLLDALRAGEIRPGDRITEEEVAHNLGVSRTPVREALLKLQSRRLIEVVPGRGMILAELDMQRMMELYAMRAILEGAAARFAAQHATSTEIDFLGQLIDEFTKADEDPQLLARMNVKFHRTLYAASRNRYVQEALSNFEDALSLLQSTTFSVEGRRQKALVEHRAIVEAIARHDADAAEREARRHIGEAQQARIMMMLVR